jgi:hypothetical protein
MLHLFGPAQPFCDRLPRRDFLKIGGLALGGLSLTDVLRAEQTQGSTSRHKGIIMIYLPGGPPHQDLYDLKIDAPVEIRGEFDPITTNVPGIEICEHLPRLAQRMDKFAVIRSLVGSDGAHASSLCLTGHRFGSDPPGGWPTIGACVSATQGPTARAIPAHADLSMRMQHTPYNITGSGYLGTSHAPFRPDKDVMDDLVLAGDSLTRLPDRKHLLTMFDRFRKEVDARRQLTTLDTATDQALDVLTSSRMVEALDLSKEDPRTRDRYGQDTPDALPYWQLGYQCLMSKFLLARRLIEAGVRVVTVTFADMDWHGSNFVFGRKVFPLFDQGITALVDDLHDRNLLDDVTVIAWGEFGRTPRINANAGRDHWPQVSCALLAGGGMKTGQVIGSTNRLGEYAVNRPIDYREVLATAYHNLGIDARQTTVNDLNHRPRYLVEDHEPVKELV